MKTMGLNKRAKSTSEIWNKLLHPKTVETETVWTSLKKNKFIIYKIPKEKKRDGNIIMCPMSLFHKYQMNVIGKIYTLYK